MKLCSIRLVALGLTMGLGLMACQQLPQQKGRGVVIAPGATLESLNPSDVVVAPVILGEEGMKVPARALRESVSRSLVKRRYAPLALDFVDDAGMVSGQGTTEASYRAGTVSEDVVCQIIVHSWKQDLWESRRALVVDVEIQMVDPMNPMGQPLWSGRLDGSMDFASQESKYAAES
ncbi:MAG: hypothetical protein KDB61_08485, partial [Planctomycetes bacterium]|nr:hypothetical protein [Planctomycetota bacterium]